jgi:hypothetical protein
MSLESPPPPPVTNTVAADTQKNHICPDKTSSDLFLTMPFGPTITITDATASGSGTGILPEISIASPTTSSSTIEITRVTPYHENFPPHTLASRALQKATGGGSIDNKTLVDQPCAPEATITRPLSTIDSIFKLGQGLGNMFTSSKIKVTTSMNSSPSNINRLRTGKNRAPTPYPGSLVDPNEDSAISEYAVSMMDDSCAPISPKTILKLSLPSPPLRQQGDHGRSGSSGRDAYDERPGYTIEDIVDNTSISLATFPSISQIPTLDGYPSIKYSSTIGLAAETSISNKTSAGKGRGGDAGRPSNKITTRPLMLPLSRTPTIQAASQAYTLSSNGKRDLQERLGGVEEPHEDEYHYDYPVVSISNNSLQSPSPISPVTCGGVGSLFRLPNCAIGVSPSSPALTPSGGMVHSSPLMTHSTGPAATPTTAFTPTGVTNQSQQRSQQLDQYNHTRRGDTSERHDPIERLLILKAQHEGDTVSQQQLESVTNPTLQFLQRTRTVANWAHEQSRIQEKRTRHYARTRALKELRKQDPTAAISMHSRSSSSFSDFSSLSSFSTTTSSSASTSKFVPAASLPHQQQQQQYYRQQQQQEYSAQVRIPPSSFPLPKEKLFINTSLGEGSSSANGKMPSLSRHFDTPLVGIDPSMEDILLDHPTRLEMLIREDDEDEEEPGLYIDADDVLNPPMDVESLGAGVGRL